MTKEAEQALQTIKQDVIQALELQSVKGGMSCTPPKMYYTPTSVLLHILVACNHGLGLDPHDKKV